jgi:hypothetical protein
MTKKFSVQTVFSGVDKLSSMVGRIGQKLNGTFGTLGSRLRGDADAFRKIGTSMFRVGQIATAAIRGVLDFTTEITNSLDVMSKTSRRAGVTAQTFQELRFAAGLSGASVEEFSGAIEKFGVSIGRLRGGKGKLLEFLKAVGPLQLKALQSTKTTEEALEVIFDGMARLEDPNKRAALAVAAFGDSGGKLALMVEKGTAGLAAMRKEFRDLGLGISPEALGISEAFNDELSKATQVWESSKLQIGASIAQAALPQLLELTQWLKDNSGDFRSALQSVGQGIVDAFVAIKDAGKWIIDNKDDLIDWAKILGGVYLATLVIPALTTTLGLIGGIGKTAAAAFGWVGKLIGVGGGAAAAGAAGAGAAGAAGVGAAGAGAGGAAAAKGAGMFGRLGAFGAGIARALPWLMVADMATSDPFTLTPDMTTELARQRAQFAAEDAQKMAGLREFGATPTGQALQQAGRILVEFANAPAGMSVKTVEAPAGGAIDVTTRRGPRTLGTGAGL